LRFPSARRIQRLGVAGKVPFVEEATSRHLEHVVKTIEGHPNEKVIWDETFGNRTEEPGTASSSGDSHSEECSTPPNHEELDMRRHIDARGEYAG
jgi:hypothetical protein